MIVAYVCCLIAFLGVALSLWLVMIDEGWITILAFGVCCLSAGFAAGAVITAREQIKALDQEWRP